MLRQVGSGLLLAAAVVGSGELVLTTVLGAEVGFILLWLILLSCAVKVVVQHEIGRYTIGTGETGPTSTLYPRRVLDLAVLYLLLHSRPRVTVKVRGGTQAIRCPSWVFPRSTCVTDACLPRLRRAGF